MKINKIVTFFCMLTLLFACEKDEERSEREEQNAINAYVESHGFTESDKLESGLYIKIFRNDINDSVTPNINQNLVFSYNGKLTSGALIETTDSALAIKKLIYFNDIVYGPLKWSLQNTVAGFSEGVQLMHEGDSAIMIIPSYLAKTNYVPLVYEIKLHKIIQDDVAYEEEMKNKYLTRLYTYYNNSIAYHITDSSSDGLIIQPGDSLQLKVTGRFAEVKGEYSNHFEGRKFFPLGGNSITNNYSVGTTNYPFVPAIDSIFSNIPLKVGTKLKIFTTSKYGFGDDGVLHANYLIPIVPSSTPIDFQIEIVKLITE